MSVAAFLFSNAQVAVAPSICFRFAIHPFLGLPQQRRERSRPRSFRKLAKTWFTRSPALVRGNATATTRAPTRMPSTIQNLLFFVRIVSPVGPFVPIGHIHRGNVEQQGCHDELRPEPVASVWWFAAAPRRGIFVEPHLYWILQLLRSDIVLTMPPLRGG